MLGADHVSRVRRLYKLILRVHRGLPPELRIMGNSYARDEFKRHKDCKPNEAGTFLSEWTDYAIKMAKQLKPAKQAKKEGVGVPMGSEMLDQMNEGQLMQLYELHQAATAAPKHAADTSASGSAGATSASGPAEDPTEQETCLNGDSK